MHGVSLRVFLFIFFLSCTHGGAKKEVEDDFDEFEFEFDSVEGEGEEGKGK